MTGASGIYAKTCMQAQDRANFSVSLSIEYATHRIPNSLANLRNDMWRISPFLDDIEGDGCHGTHEVIAAHISALPVISRDQPKISIGK